MKLGTWHQRTAPVVGAWLVAVVILALLRDRVDASGWLLVHLVALGAISSAILIWSWYFTEAVLRLGRDHGKRTQAIRLAAFNAGAITVTVGIAFAWWPATLAGGIVVGMIALWHGLALARQLRGALPSRFGPMVRYYAAAGMLLPLGAVLGVLLARAGLGGDWYARLITAHAAFNVFGWVGLTVLGTLVTLWPTILRTRIAAGVEQAALRGLPALLVAAAVIVGGALAGWPPLVAVGLAGYLAAAGYVLYPHVDEARRKHPVHFPPMSVLAAVVWLLACLATLTVRAAITTDIAEVERALRAVVPLLVFGFLAQVLIGALSYLLPVVLAGRPSATQAATATLDRFGATRVTAANAGLLLTVLPVPAAVVTAGWWVTGLALAAFLPLAVLAVVRARRILAAPPVRPDPARKRVDPQAGRRRAHAAVGLVAVLVAAGAGVAVDRFDSPAPAVATGETTEVTVQVDGMRYAPSVIDVPRGDRLVIDFDNTGDTTHDLVLAGGARTALLAPGQSERLDAGVIGADVEGWCSVAGHRQMGMVLQIRATGSDDPAADTDAPADPAHEGGSGDGAGATASDGAEVALRAADDPGPDFQARDPHLAPAERPDDGVHRVELAVTDTEIDVAPDYRQTVWPYAGQVPGPVLRGQVGDRFEIVLRNDATIGHSIDFHAGALAPDEPMRTIEPGEELVYSFTATRSGAWLYHCSTEPMSLHIANGMFGAVIIDPPDLPPVDQELVFVQSEFYLGPDGEEADAAKAAADRPDLTVFNGRAFQYVHDPVTVRIGERVRIWVVTAGPNRGTAFHVVGGQFDTVYKEGAYLLRPGDPGGGGAQVLDLAPAQGGFVELTFDEAGTYTFVDHAMAYAERGATGTITVVD